MTAENPRWETLVLCSRGMGARLSPKTRPFSHALSRWIWSLYVIKNTTLPVPQNWEALGHDPCPCRWKGGGWPPKHAPPICVAISNMVVLRQRM